MNETLEKVKDFLYSKGKVIASEEYIIDNKAKIAAFFKYENEDIKTKVSEGKLVITSEFFGDETGKYYANNITHKAKDKDSNISISFNSSQLIGNVFKVLDYIERIIDKDNTLPARTHTFENTKDTLKQGDEYYVQMSDNSNYVIAVDKSSSVLEDGRTFIVSNEKPTEYYFVSREDDSHINVTMDDNLDIDTVSYFTEDMYKTYYNMDNTEVPVDIPCNQVRPKNMQVSTHVGTVDEELTIIYDKYGMVTSKLNYGTVYSYDYTTEDLDNTYIHEEVFDSFSMICEDNIFCIDTLCNGEKSDTFRGSKDDYRFKRVFIKVKNEDIKSLEAIFVGK